jgi:hypothetical protein
MKLTTVAITAAVTLAAATTFAPPAGADEVDRLATAICTAFETNPRPATVGAVGNILIEEGADAEQAAAIVVISVLEYCPQHFGLIQQFSTSAGTYA